MAKSIVYITPTTHHIRPDVSLNVGQSHDLPETIKISWKPPITLDIESCTSFIVNDADIDVVGS